MANIGTYHLADNPQLYEPSRSNNFEFVISDLGDLKVAGVADELATENDYFSGAEDVIRIACNDASVPHYEVSTLDVRRGNNMMHFAGTPTFGTEELKLNDYIGARVKDILLAWQAQVYDVTNEKVKLAKNYKRDCTLIEYTPDYDTIIRTWTLKGCWISKISEGNFSADTNDLRKIDVTIVYDRAIPNMEKTEQTA